MVIEKGQIVSADTPPPQKKRENKTANNTGEANPTWEKFLPLIFLYQWTLHRVQQAVLNNACV